MKHSLKIKFIALVLFSLGLATLPAAFIASDSLRQYTMASERQAFYSLTTLMEENILQRYMNIQKMEAQSVRHAKEDLLGFAQITNTFWGLRNTADGWEGFQHTLRTLLSPLKHKGFEMDVYAGGGHFRLKTSLFAELAREMTRTDFKGDTLYTMLHETPPKEGLFAVFLLNAEELNNIRGEEGEDEGDAVLVLFYPLGDEILCLALPLIGMDLWQQHRVNAILRELRGKLERLGQKKAVEAGIMSRDGTILVSTPDAINLDPQCIPPHVLDEARRNKNAEFVEETHDDLTTRHIHSPNFLGRLYRIAYLRTLDWYVVTSVEISDLAAPGKALARHLVMAGLAAAVFSLLGTLLLAERLTAPLRALMDQAQKLATTDFSRPEALASRVLEPSQDNALRTRGDEVGQLAAAFGHMEEALGDNIRHLMEVTAAKERMQGELDAARRIQRGILPPYSDIPPHAAVTLAAFLEPAKEVGGDFYDFMKLPDGRMAVVIGDVSDKGVPAALFMAMTVTLVRSALMLGMEPASVLQYANNALCAHNPQNMFVTLWVGVLDPVSGVLDYANGGHCLPLLLRAPESSGANTNLSELDFLSGPLVGALEGVTYEGAQIRLHSGDACLLYSDGVTEAEDGESFFGMARMHTSVAGGHARSPKALLDRVYAAVESFRGDLEQSDDITMLCVRWIG